MIIAMRLANIFIKVIIPDIPGHKCRPQSIPMLSVTITAP